jgi:hypothetical protein
MATVLYDPSLNLQQALDLFFEKYNLGEQGGLNSDWAYLDMKWFRIPFPNTVSRKKALVLHDIHHIVTGYQSDWQGEAEIAAWEVASGCGEYSAAWFLDLGGIAMGLFFYPVKTFKAFIRGRRTTNLYLGNYTKEDLLKMNIKEIQEKLKLDVMDSSAATPREILGFVGWSLVSALWYIPFLIIYAALAWCILF